MFLNLRAFGSFTLNGATNILGRQIVFTDSMQCMNGS